MFSLKQQAYLNFENNIYLCNYIFPVLVVRKFQEVGKNLIEFPVNPGQPREVQIFILKGSIMKTRAVHNFTPFRKSLSTLDGNVRPYRKRQF